MGELSFTEEEDVDVDVVIRREIMEGMVARGKSCIIGKLLYNMLVSKEILKKEMVRWWKPTGWLTFKVVGENMFLMEFEYHWEKVRVLEGRHGFLKGAFFQCPILMELRPRQQLNLRRCLARFKCLISHSLVWEPI